MVIIAGGKFAWGFLWLGFVLPDIYYPEVSWSGVQFGWDILYLANILSGGCIGSILPKF